MATEFNIFFHNEEKLGMAIGQHKLPPSYNLIDLNKLKLPDQLVIEGMDLNVNKAIYSEYLGILLLKPKSELVGCFTYSIPLKFSARWCLESGNNHFQPSIRIEELDNLHYEADILYAVELVTPYHLVPKQMRSLTNVFSLAQDPKVGPFKGSFIIEKSVFEKLQRWLWKVVQHILQAYALNDMASIESLFDKSLISQRTAEELKIDKLRHTYGTLLERAVAYFLGAEYYGKKTILIGNLMKQFREQDELVRSCKNISENNTVVIAFGDIRYINVIEEWLKRIVKLQVRNYVFISLDDETQNYLVSRGYNTSLVPYKGNLGEFWVFRLKVIRRLLESGLNVVHSDADAFWLSNPLDNLSLSTADIVSSQGSIFPESTLQHWGFVLCCGFQMFRSTLNCLALFERLIPYVEEVKDDQIAVNEVLMNMGVTWERDNTGYTLTHQGKSFTCYKKHLIGKCDSLTVQLLPHAQYQRYFEGINPDLKVLHLLSDKTQGAKLRSLENIESQLRNSVDDKSSSNVIWLASYPRTGNTLLRTIFKHNFGIPTYSLYNDKADIGKYEGIREFVGHKDGQWGCITKGVYHFPNDEMAINDTSRNELTIIKTHSQYCEYYKNKKIIYIVRDPRAVLTSYVSYKKNFTKTEKRDINILEELIFSGDRMSGYWVDHIESWFNQRSKNMLIIRYEDILEKFEEVLKEIANFLDLEPISKKWLDFSHYKKADPRFFRKGKKTSWQTTLCEFHRNKIGMSTSKFMQIFNYQFQYESDESRNLNISLSPKSVRKNWVYVCTPVLNAANTVDSTILSVITQEGDFFLHYHIKDGGSTDGTIDKLTAWQKTLANNPHLVRCKNLLFTFSSESDNGMYEAVNQSIDYMQIPEDGVLTYINSDDVLFPGAIATASKIFDEITDSKWIIPSKYTISEQGSHRGAGFVQFERNDIVAGKCNGNDKPFIQQEGVFWLKALWDEVGGFNLSLKLSADWDLWMRFAYVCAPVTTHYVFGAFRKRPGQLSESIDIYLKEVANHAQPMNQNIGNEPIMQIKLAENGKYELVPQSTKSNHFMKGNESTTLPTSAYVKIDGWENCISRYKETGFKSYLAKKMPQEKQPFETSELLDDINYINQSNSDEIKKMNEVIWQHFTAADLTEKTTDLIVEEVASQLGQLSAKVKLTEKVIHAMQPEKMHKFVETVAKSVINDTDFKLRFAASQLAGNRNLLPIESSDNGISYIWSGSDPEIQFTFPLDRSKAIGMQVRLFALIKPEYSKQLMILIDGESVRHRFGQDEGLFVLSCNLPTSTKTNQTTITIVLPATHSPMDLGSSNDRRKLGIAFHEFRFGKPENEFSHLLKRLKLKT